MKRRAGVSLVELITVLGGMTAILSLTAVLMTRAMQSQAQTRHFLECQGHALALSEQFRRDVHQARSAALDRAALKENELVELKLNDGQTIAYLRMPHGLARVLVKADKPVSREEYELGGAVDPIVRQENSPARLVLLVAAPEATPPGPDEPASRIREKPAVLQTEAVLGSDWRETRRAAAGGSP